MSHQWRQRHAAVELLMMSAAEWLWRDVPGEPIAVRSRALLGLYDRAPRLPGSVTLRLLPFALICIGGFSALITPALVVRVTGSRSMRQSHLGIVSHA